VRSPVGRVTQNDFGMLTAFAFIVAIAALVVVHELGHYAMAVACGVKVLHFSVGFGPRLWGWTSPKRGTEFVVAAFPLGGFVKMLDEREGPVDPAQRGMAFNVQPLRSRSAIVAAGPLANLALAVLLYAIVHWIGVEQPEPVLSKPSAGSVFAQAGFSGGERVQRAGYDADNLQPVLSFEDVRWWLTHGALEHRDITLEYAQANHRSPKLARIPLGTLEHDRIDASLFQKIGVSTPFSQARLEGLVEGAAASEAGLRAGDVVERVDGRVMQDAAQLRELIRLSGRDGQAKSQMWQVRRAGALQEIAVTPRVEFDKGVSIGRVGAYIGAPVALVLVRYGVVDGLVRAVERTWDVSALTLQMMGKIVVGDASIRNLSGPITIAEYAGKSAAIGFTSYVLFLALISVSLGVLNLLPVPVLDGGHLLYDVWEWISGKPVPDSWMENLQRVGFAMLLLLMSVAVFNDVTRLLG